MNRRKRSILIIDNEIEIVRVLRRSLTTHGYEVFVVNSGEEALESMQQHTPNLILLDLRLPGMSGLEVCKWVRAQSDLPIIVISARNEECDKVHALDLGADDYISKPFGMNEVLARIRVALRHAVSMALKAEPVLTIGPLCVDFAQRLVFVNTRQVKLTPTEYDLLIIFIQNRGKVMTQSILLTQVWGTNYSGKVHYLHVYVGQLRRKIEPDPAHPRFFLTISGVGYLFSAEKYADSE